MRLKTWLVLASLLLVVPVSAFAAKGEDHWVGSWGASPFGAPTKDGKFGDSTVRNTVHLSIGGSALRIKVTNEFGTDPLMIDAASVGWSAGGGAVKAGTSKPVMFGGKATIIIPAGAMAVSDAIAMPVAPLSDLTISLHLPEQKMAVVSAHGNALSTNYLGAGNQVDAATMTDAKTQTHWYFLKNVDVLAGAESAAIVTLGDSITDGATSTIDTNGRWPDELSRRLQADKKLAHLGVINEGIGGNRILHDTTGPSALARFDRDVLAQAGVKYLIILESINDIGHSEDPRKPYDKITADDLIQGMVQMIDRAHEHGIKVYGATLTPYLDAGYSSPSGEAVRVKVNEFIRHGGKFDGAIDFEKAVDDPKSPMHIAPLYNIKDHLHPNDAGYKAMGDAVDLKLFR